MNIFEFSSNFHITHSDNTKDFQKPSLETDKMPEEGCQEMSDQGGDKCRHIFAIPLTLGYLLCVIYVHATEFHPNQINIFVEIDDFLCLSTDSPAVVREHLSHTANCWPCSLMKYILNLHRSI